MVIEQDLKDLPLCQFWIIEYFQMYTRVDLAVVATETMLLFFR